MVMFKGKKFLLFLIILMNFLCINNKNVYASSGINITDQFEGLSGDGKYLGKNYRDNYRLDIEDTNIFEAGDAMMNNIANALFSIITNLGFATTAFFYFTMQFDITKVFADQIDTIQTALKSSIFDTFFILAFSASAWGLFKRIAKKDMAGLFIDCAKIVIIFLLSAFIVTHSSDTLSATTSITKSISVSALMDINNQSGNNIKDYASSASGMIWSSLVHSPWKSLEFDGSNTPPANSDIENFLTTVGDERDTLIKNYVDTHKGAMSKDLGVKRIGFLIVYLIPFFVKSGIYMFMAVLQLAFQVMAVFYILLAAVILLLALIPAFGGIDLVSTWLKKIFETQLMMLIITFLIGVIISLDNFLYGLSSEYGWFIVIMMETLVTVVIVINHKSILKGMSKMANNTQQPRALKYKLNRMGNIIEPLGAGNKNISSKRKAYRSKSSNDSSFLKKKPYKSFEAQDKQASNPDNENTNKNTISRKPAQTKAKSSSKVLDNLVISPPNIQTMPAKRNIQERIRPVQMISQKNANELPDIALLPQKTTTNSTTQKRLFRPQSSIKQTMPEAKNPRNTSEKPITATSNINKPVSSIAKKSESKVIVNNQDTFPDKKNNGAALPTNIPVKTYKAHSPIGTPVVTKAVGSTLEGKHITNQPVSDIAKNPNNKVIISSRVTAPNNTNFSTILSANAPSKSYKINTSTGNRVITKAAETISQDKPAANKPILNTTRAITSVKTNSAVVKPEKQIEYTNKKISIKSKRSET